MLSLTHNMDDSSTNCLIADFHFKTFEVITKTIHLESILHCYLVICHILIVRKKYGTDNCIFDWKNHTAWQHSIFR